MVRPTVKHCRGLVMVWGSMTTIGTGLICRIYGRMIQFAYHEVLDSKLYGIFRKLGFNPTRVVTLFQHDNDPKHIAKSLRQLFCL